LFFFFQLDFTACSSSTPPEFDEINPINWFFTWNPVQWGWLCPTWMWIQRLMVSFRELNCRPLLFEGTTPIFSRTSWQPVLDVPGWSRNGISGPGHNRGLQIQISSADWGSSVQIFPHPGFIQCLLSPGATAWLAGSVAACKQPSILHLKTP
jgi:hypothetical protein